jgi:hypothetical protein
VGWGDLLARDRRGFAPISIGQDGCLEIPLTDGRDNITGKPLDEQDPLYKGVSQRLSWISWKIFMVRNLANFRVRGPHKDSTKTIRFFFSKNKGVVKIVPTLMSTQRSVERLPYTAPSLLYSGQCRTPDLLYRYYMLFRKGFNTCVRACTCICSPYHTHKTLAGKRF